MGKRKNSSAGGDETIYWNHDMDGKLIDAFVHQHEIGNRVGGTFTSKAYKNIVEELSTIYPDLKINKQHVQSRIKYVKRGFSACYDIFKNFASGFSWNPITNMWNAEPEVWDNLIKAHPEAASWIYKPIYNYEKLVILYGEDRATGEDVDVAREYRKRYEESDQRTERSNTIDEIDRMVSNDEMYFSGNEINTNENETPSNNQSEGTSSRKKKKSKERKDDSLESIKESFQIVADAILKSTAEIVKAQSGPQKSELWSILENLGLEIAELNKAYIYLLDNPNMLDGFLGCPSTARKDLLREMMLSKKKSSE